MMDDFYRENILEHYRNPRNYGHLDHPDLHAEGNNPLCGDEIGIELNVQDGVVTAIKFHGRGCAISQASASMLTEMVEGKPVEELKNLGKDEILEALGIEVSPARLKCALLPLRAMFYAVTGQKYVADDEEE